MVKYLIRPGSTFHKEGNFSGANILAILVICFAFFSFVSFFPQLVAGPIERAVNLLPQFNQKRTSCKFGKNSSIYQHFNNSSKLTSHEDIL